jgi:hypothetical protein
MKRTFILRIAAVCLLLVLQCGQGQIVERTPVATEHAAAAIAETAFLKATNHKITNYSVHARQHTAERWYFQIEGEGAFARPGYHWTVSVDHATGKTEILSGE